MLAAVPTDRLRPDHPRLMATPEILASAKARVAADPLGRIWEKQVYGQAVALLPRPTAAAVAGIGDRRKLEDPAVIGRTLLANLQLLGIAYLWWGEDRFARRGIVELLEAAVLPTWGTAAQFLDVAETAHAFAIGFDWLHGRMSESERAIVAGAVVEKALKPGLAAIEAGVLWAQQPEGWNLNWILVCNGGLALAALGVFETDPDLCGRVLARTLEPVPTGLPGFAPDGGWGEGPGYWHYASAYIVYLLAGLETAIGSDLGLADAAGLDRTGEFRLHVEGPSGFLFNYADGDPTHSGLPWMLWLARRYGRPVDAWVERVKPKAPYPLDLLWFDSDASDPAVAGQPLDRRFAGIEVATLRGAWNDASATYVAVKGGSNRASDHSHLDLGTFVLDSGGQRFAVDLGEDNYALPGYFDRTLRFGYYRTGSIGHNVVLLDGGNQRPEATAEITRFQSTPAMAGVSIDLSRLYQQGALKRTVLLIQRRHVLIADEIVPFQPTQPTWQMHTPAAVALAGRLATLTLAGARITLRVIEPTVAVVATAACHPPPPQNPNQGITKLVVALPQVTAPTRIVVALSPDLGWIPDAAALSALTDLR